MYVGGYKFKYLICPISGSCLDIRVDHQIAIIPTYVQMMCDSYGKQIAYSLTETQRFTYRSFWLYTI